VSVLSERQAEHVFNDNLQDVHKTLGHGMTTGSQLTQVGESLFGKKYIGTYPCDEIPDNIQNEHFMIVNNTTRKHGGEHWVAVAKHNDTLFVFDSFGRPTKDLIPTLYTQGIIVDTDYDRDQKEQQTDCGSRAIAWLKLFHEYGFENALLI
jgi:hypothetical protein